MMRKALLLVTALALVVGLGAGRTVTTERHLSDADALTIGASTAAIGSSYSFSTVYAGSPLRWDPCTPIHWRFRTTGAPVGGLTAVVRAIGRIAAITGTRWVYDGATTLPPTTSMLPTKADQRPPVVIGWALPVSSDLLRGQSPNVLGVTRTSWFGVTRSGTTTAAIRGAVIALNMAKRLPVTGPVSWYTTSLHELAHAMGLGHATSTRQLMYPVLQPALRDLQSGDVAGLTRLGRTAGCIRL